MTRPFTLQGVRRVAQRQRQRPREAGVRQVRRLPGGSRVRSRQHPPGPGVAGHCGGLLQVCRRGVSDDMSRDGEDRRYSTGSPHQSSEI